MTSKKINNERNAIINGFRADGEFRVSNNFVPPSDDVDAMITMVAHIQRSIRRSEIVGLILSLSATL